MMHEIESQRIKDGGGPISHVRLCLTRELTTRKTSKSIKACNEIAVVYVTDDNIQNPKFERDICIEPRNNNEYKSRTIPIISKHVDPLVYPLLFPKGKTGWHPGMISPRTGKRITTLQYYSFHMHNRGHFNPYINFKRLTQQFVVDAYTKIESNRLYYIRKEQNKFRVEEYGGLTDYVHNKAYENSANIGKMVILPSSFYDGPRARQQNFQDSMCFVRNFGKPDLFLTMTTNPNWKEIQENLMKHETCFDRPDLVARVFKRKVSKLIELLTVHKILGEIKGYLYTVEFQKRGLPHIHMLIYLEDGSIVKNIDNIDELISAEIPDEFVNPKLYDMVKRHMIHGPCGAQNLNAGCMSDKKECTKNFPKSFRDDTEYNNDNGYPLYKRPDNGRNIIYQSGNTRRIADNRYVVPYNPYLLLKLDCHINLEVCCTLKCVKYLYKYVFKGPDMATIKLSSTDENGNAVDEVEYDEVTQYLSARYLCPPEAMWRTFAFSMHEMSHSVNRLAVHLEHKQQIYYTPGFEEEALKKITKPT